MFVPISPAPFVGPVWQWWQGRRAPVCGWNFRLDRPEEVNGGRMEASISMRFIGAGEAYEVQPRIWADGKCKKHLDGPTRLAKMTCESDPLVVYINYEFPQGDGPWIGVSWVEPTKYGAVEQAARQSVTTMQFERWQWHRKRNLWRGPNTAPKGEWSVIPVVTTRKTFKVPPSLDLAMTPEIPGATSS
ncbi:hypothetical protein VMT65_29420 [Nocardia sp. CDC153]|uniref:hypothetical protein n=1 Tax=Nocardia sp. CDC153 TaxID=3112167 RepID=UPI002DB5E2A5|nr:hypothetical protein [Nocardia sp. CDC153]MEC3957185.1 hypothetical protein [Nocardia sp. CDC153]